MTLIPLCPPDCENFTGLYPADKPSWIDYPPLAMTFSQTRPFTIALWVRLLAIMPDETPVLSVVLPDGSQLPLIKSVMVAGVQSLTIGLGGLKGTFRDPERNRWYFLTIAYDGEGLLVFYVDGAPTGFQRSASFRDLPNPSFRIGGDGVEPAPGGPHPLNGEVRTLRVWESRLTEEEIQSEMWAAEPQAQRDALTLATDFSQSPPGVTAGPEPKLTNTAFQMQADCVWAFSPLAPGQSTDIDPGGAPAPGADTAPGPFSLVAWVQTGKPDLRDSPLAVALSPTGGGCIFSNRDIADAQHLAVLVDDAGVVSVQLGPQGAGVQVAAPAEPLPPGQWVCVAVTYDGASCSLYLNGALAAGPTAVTLTAPATPASPRLLGRMANGHTIDIFMGVLQYLSVWNIALSPDEVVTAMYSDPSEAPRCVADFSGSDLPPQDLSQLLSAVWAANALVPCPDPGIPTTWIGYISVGAYCEGMNPPAGRLVDAAPPEPMVGRIAFHNPQTYLPAVDAAVEPFGEAHKAQALAALAALVGVIPDEQAQRAMLARYSKDLDRAFADAAAGNGPPSPVEIVVDGSWLTVTDRATGELIAKYEVDISPNCAAWWLGFLCTLIPAFLRFFGLEIPTREMTRRAKQIVEDAGVIAMLGTVEGQAMTGWVLLRLVKVLYDKGYMWSIVKAALASLGWWGAAKVLIKVIAYFQPIPNIEQAKFIAQTAVAVAQLAYALTQYKSSCGQGVCDVAPEASRLPSFA